MKSASPNQLRLIRTARRIEPLLGEVVFVGGQLAELLVTDPGSARLRVTDDVDVVVSVASRAEYHRIQEHLRGLGFSPDTREGAPICRMRTSDDLILDVMPIDEDILGFTNRWYPYTIETAQPLTLEDGLTIRAITASAFLATKWEAFTSRGNNNFLMSHDVEDIIAVVAGRAKLIGEVRDAPVAVREFIAAQIRQLLRAQELEEVVMDALPDTQKLSGSLETVLSRFRELAATGGDS